MIQFLVDNIDQLDLALDQLAMKERNFDRFALMLIDNVVELTLHRYAENEANTYKLNNKLWTPSNPKSETEAMGNALTQNFEPKVKFAQITGLIDEATKDLIIQLHKFRNTAYHQGKRHDGILHSLALVYFRKTCAICENYSPIMHSINHGDKLSHRALKYIGELSLSNNNQEIFPKAFHRLFQVALSMEENLIGDLYVDMRKDIDFIDKSIQRLVDADPEHKKTREQIIREAQAIPFIFTDEAKKFAKDNNYSEGDFFSYLCENYSWSVKYDPIPDWQKRLENLKIEKDYNKALQRYRDMARDIEKTYPAIENAIENFYTQKRLKDSPHI